MFKLVEFLYENVKKEDVQVAINNYGKKALAWGKDADYQAVRNNSDYFYQLLERVVTTVYSSINIMASVQLINKYCNLFKEKCGVDVTFLVFCLLDRIRIEKGIDWRTVQCPRDLMLSFGNMGFTINYEAKGCGDVIYKGRKDSMLYSGYSVVLTWDTYNQSWVAFRKVARANFVAFQDKVKDAPYFLEGTL